MLYIAGSRDLLKTTISGLLGYRVICKILNRLIHMDHPVLQENVNEERQWVQIDYKTSHDLHQSELKFNQRFPGAYNHSSSFQIDFLIL